MSSQNVYSWKKDHKFQRALVYVGYIYPFIILVLKAENLG